MLLRALLPSSASGPEVEDEPPPVTPGIIRRSFSQRPGRRPQPKTKPLHHGGTEPRR
jgi:hypothetical protein